MKYLEVCNCFGFPLSLTSKGKGGVGFEDRVGFHTLSQQVPSSSLFNFTVARDGMNKIKNQSHPTYTKTRNTTQHKYAPVAHEKRGQYMYNIM